MSEHKTFEDIQKEVGEIMGAGKVIPTLIGIEEDGETPKIKKYHITPVSLSKLGELGKLLDDFFESTNEEKNNSTGLGDDFIAKGVAVVKMSLLKMHPNIEDKEIMENFGLEGIAKAIKIIMGVNEFTKEVGEMQAQMEKMTSLGKN